MKAPSMPSARRTLCAGLWGVPGPANVVIHIALAVGLYPYESFSLTTLKQAAHYWPIPLAEAIMGFIYGVMRSTFTASDAKWFALNLRRGTMLGAFVGSVVGAPLLLMVTSGLGLSFAFVPPHVLADLGLILGVCVGQAFGGAVAGFHVEYYLLRGRS
jgi:hypothetical protein